MACTGKSLKRAQLVTAWSINKVKVARLSVKSSMKTQSIKLSLLKPLKILFHLWNTGKKKVHAKTKLFKNQKSVIAKAIVYY